MEILVVVISWLLFGGVSSYFASQRGRDPFVWFLIGMLLGILGLLLLFLLPPVTSTENEMPLEEEAPVTQIEEPRDHRMKEWFYLDQERNQVGPCSFSQLRKSWDEGKLTIATLVWSEGMEEWRKVEELPHLKQALE